MALGPVELLVVKFPGTQLKGEIVPALRELVDTGTIRIVDLVFIRKDANGAVTTTELSDLDDDTYAALDPLVAEITGLISEDDELQLADMLENDSSAGLLLFENAWATRFREAIANARGEVVLDERIPNSVIEDVTSARTADQGLLASQMDTAAQAQPQM
ncbi:MAG: hypothetical protein OJF49_000996 [Ktedonobacterales bacterium]|jgi:hypothetical protein|nr:MAG: hypothetical protein OJF49_000996 [Ktedonobacterales bacterium]